ncbi:Acylglycerol kinase, mitochondrial [Holothuria leucospilota]|uniref:Acylglycerol kinase, mitochondrial n=1 Tax=Holothuria leucospilota TaxID=206669 RepID=A0A9Q1BJU3_HOLLE|nr:Acylglycerol kinase, mitochondrial [Holothuria leucospilota]
MAAVVKSLKTLRNHWKKSTFAVVAGSYGVYYLNNRHKENLIRREYCELARNYGQQPIHATAKVKKVTVFLNPAARHGKASKLFQKNAAPILHLAGVNVEIIQSQREGHVKDLVEGLSATDIIVVVGGDGTLAELVTGLLRREDEDNVSRKWPIGVIPVGTTNTLARYLYEGSQNEVRWMCNAAMAIVKGLTIPIDVMAIKDADGRTTYAVNHLRWGPLDDAKEKQTKYWYFGPLKQRMAVLFHTLSQNWPPSNTAKLSYGGPKDIPEPPIPPVEPSIWTKIYWRLFGKPEVKIKEEEEDTASTEPKTNKDVTSMEIIIQTNQLQEIEGKKFLSLLTGPEHLSRGDFIKEGWQRLSSNIINVESSGISFERESIGDVDIAPKLTEDKTAWFTIDSERFEAGPVSITLLPNKLNFFGEPHSAISNSFNSLASETHR